MSEYPYPWYARVWPLSRVFFRGFEYGEESGIRRGRFQMGAEDTADTAPQSHHPACGALDEPCHCAERGDAPQEGRDE